MMVRHASRSPNPNITGPNVPEENLEKKNKTGKLNKRNKSSLRKPKNKTYERILTFMEKNIKKILL